MLVEPPLSYAQVMSATLKDLIHKLNNKLAVAYANFEYLELHGKLDRETRKIFQESNQALQEAVNVSVDLQRVLVGLPTAAEEVATFAAEEAARKSAPK